jgi:hypothetical protein
MYLLLATVEQPVTHNIKSIVTSPTKGSLLPTLLGNKKYALAFLIWAVWMSRSVVVDGSVHLLLSSTISSLFFIDVEGEVVVLGPH